MTKRALLIGINYPGTSHELRGCVNDVDTMFGVLTKHYDFPEKNIAVLTDDTATTQNIKDYLNWLVMDAQPGDTLFFHYSGHGSQIHDDSDPDYEPDGLDEILCPIDLDWETKVVRDDDLKRAFDRVPNGVNLTALLDCCHSGGGMDHNIQHQPLGLARETMLERKMMTEKGVKGRYLPPPIKIQEKIGNIELDQGFKERSLQTRDINQTGMMISGCQSHQTSADAFIGGMYRGACTHYLTQTLAQYGYNIDYVSLVNRMNDDMVTHGYTQRPELNGPMSLHRKPFLYDWNTPKPVFVDTPQPVNFEPEFQEECSGIFCFFRGLRKVTKRIFKRK